MERLTYDCYFGDIHWWHVKGAGNLGCRQVCEEQEENGCKGCPIELAFDRLAAYEDTGLTPAEVQAMRWIPVEERLPEEEGVYIVCVDGEVKWDAYCMFEGVERWLCYDGRLNALYIDPYSSKLTREPPYPRVTHWMPLPPSPPAKGEK